MRVRDGIVENLFMVMDCCIFAEFGFFTNHLELVQLR